MSSQQKWVSPPSVGHGQSECISQTLRVIECFRAWVIAELAPMCQRTRAGVAPRSGTQEGPLTAGATAASRPGPRVVLGPTADWGSQSAGRHHVEDGYVADVAEYPTLFEWAGGRDSFDRLINAFYDRVEQDELLSPFFPDGVHEEHRRNVATWWCEVFGGPAEYTTELGGYERMLHMHLQLGITDEQRFRFASLMSMAADDAQMPKDLEFRSALVAYLEWGTRLALGNSQEGADVVEHAPVPLWGWGEAPPFQAR